MKKKLVSAILVTRNRKREVLKAISSIYQQTYKPIEVIILENGSFDKTAEIVKKKYPKTKIVISKTNLGAAGGRNLGLIYAKGKFILFMDDDAVASKNMILRLMEVMEKNPKIGIVQPKIYNSDKTRVLQGVGHDIDLLTGRVRGIGVGEEDHGQYDLLEDIPMVGCTWIVRREVFNKVGNYDEDFFIPYEDSDFSLRTKKAGYRLYFVPKAIVWHGSHQASDIHPRLRWLGITNSERAYRISRNKIIFMKKHAPFLNLLVFLFVFVPIYTLMHSAIILLSRRPDILIYYWRGLLSGLKYALTK